MTTLARTSPAGSTPPSSADRHASTGAKAPAAGPPARPDRRRSNQTVPLILLVVLGGAWLALVALGWPYYRLPIAERLHHPWHAMLKPNGTIGLLYGYAGSFLIVLLLAYSARKRWRPLRRLGVLNKWLRVHITCGLLGPAFVTLHSGFKFHGAIAIGYWAMIGVMLSGFVGYYLYRQIPHALAGHANESELLRAEIDALDRELAERFGLGPVEIETLRRAAGTARADRLGPIASLGFLVAQDFGFALGLRRLRHTGLRRFGRAETARLRALSRRRVIVERRYAFLRQTEALFGYWHAIHKPFAIVGYSMMGLHIGIAIWLGYAWPW
jgi:hypothetical protein